MPPKYYVPLCWPGNEEWQILQDQTTYFANDTFGNTSDPLPPLHHLKEEVDELIEAPGDITEFADCFILLVQAAKRSGFNMNDLYKASREKHRINTQREWGAPDANGVVKHVKR